ncbi:uncharacterized protein E0L32_011283 [Thyridium curvatum]|uniref:Zn(2)-C6 fungal-type domain-containing protein n=1 Tax=Thyridium curvatum TaxID=1093900 RepID=A0A507BNB6_9PEZI|nr:uncharacterized protein E0L32_011283 [Thyridium curvatum]TPX19039.1 hypothetical protein E0L32_011283 [Thyridium curvatum]
MSASAGRANKAPPKRMRLGTRSCAECRRRKVRCVFPDKASMCEGCALHGVECRPQQPPGSQRRDLEHGTALERRLDEIEALLRQQQNLMSANQQNLMSANHLSVSTPSSQGQGDAQSSAFQHQFQGPSLDTPSTQPSNGWARTEPTSSPGASEGSGDAARLDVLNNSPLFRLFKEALSLMQKDPESSITPIPTPSNTHTQVGIETFDRRRNIFDHLSKQTLEQILDKTKRCWGIWPPCFFGSRPLRNMTVLEMSDFISTAIGSTDTAMHAKVHVWIALCIFELPRAWVQQFSELAQPDALIDTLLSLSRHLLAVRIQSGETLDQIETLALEAKLCIDLGRPRQAWQAVRQAINSSLLLGLHRTMPENNRGLNLWRILLHSERQLCVVLGLPSSISSLNKSLIPEPDNSVPLQRLMHEMTIIFGGIADRNQAMNEDKSSILRTMEFGHRWESSKSIMPDEFWSSPPPSGLTFEELYLRQTVKIQFFMLGKDIHLPFFLVPPEVHDYPLSRTGCLVASREVIISYLDLHRGAGPELAPCGLMDFEAFSAGVVMAIRILRAAVNEIDTFYLLLPHRSLLVELVEALRHASTLKECTVAGQAADVLGKLVALIREDMSQPYQDIEATECDVTIPFFGRLRIKVLHAPADQDTDPPSPAPVAEVAGLPTTAFPAVEFGAMPFGSDAFANFDLNAELTADWSTAVETTGDLGYDWLPVFQ